MKVFSPNATSVDLQLLVGKCNIYNKSWERRNSENLYYLLRYDQNENFHFGSKLFKSGNLYEVEVKNMKTL